MENDFYSVAEVAEAAGVTEPTIYNYLKLKEFKVYKKSRSGKLGLNLAGLEAIKEKHANSKGKLKEKTKRIEEGNEKIVALMERERETLIQQVEFLQKALDQAQILLQAEQKNRLFLNENKEVVKLSLFEKIFKK